MELKINITHEDGLSFFKRMGLEVKTVTALVHEKVYHNDEMVLKQNTLAVIDPYTRKPVAFETAYRAVMEERLKHLLFSVEKVTVYSMLKNLPKLNIQNNEQN